MNAAEKIRRERQRRMEEEALNEEVKRPKKGPRGKRLDSALRANNAATTIQRHWRGFLGRRLCRRKLALLDEVLGLTAPLPQRDPLIDKYNRQFEESLDLQRQAEAHLRQKLEAEERRVA